MNVCYAIFVQALVNELCRQAESGSDRLAAGVPEATLLEFLCEIYDFLELPRPPRKSHE